MALEALEGFKPPAKKTGTFTFSTMVLLISQLCVLPVPPSSFVTNSGFPLSNKIQSTNLEISRASLISITG